MITIANQPQRFINLLLYTISLRRMFSNSFLLFQIQRRNSDLQETSLRKRTLTASSSVNLDMSRSVSRSNLARSVSGSISNLTRPGAMTRSTSSSSFTSLTRSGNRQPESKKMNMGLTKTKSTSNLGLGAKSKLSSGSESVEKLRRELEASQHLVTSLRAELEISGAQTQVCHVCMQQIITNIKDKHNFTKKIRTAQSFVIKSHFEIFFTQVCINLQSFSQSALSILR